MDLKLKYVHAIPRKSGSFRHFFERRGYPSARLHGEPDSVQFMADYAAALAQPPLKGKPVTGAAVEPGSLAALIDEYMKCQRYTQLSPSWQKEMGYVLKKARESNGGMMVKDITSVQCERWVDDFGERTGAANKWIRVFKVLMKFAKKRGYISVNPMEDVQLLKGGEHRAWTDEEIATFIAYWRIGTRERLGFALAYYTGQRRSDVAAMRWKEIVADCIKVKPFKTRKTTKVTLKIPLHPELGAVLALLLPDPEKTIFQKEDGGKMNEVTFGQFMADAIKAAGLPDDCVLHGLRKSATNALIEAGCSPHEAAAVTGHSSTRMIEHYARDRNQGKLAEGAMEKWTAAKAPKGAKTPKLLVASGG